MDWLLAPWPWYIAGPLMGLTVPLLLLLTGKTFGISSSLRHLGSMCSPNSKLSYLKENDWLKESWNLFFVLGIALGGLVAMHFLVPAPFPLLPEHYRSDTGLALLFFGGVLVGLGTRYADGCTGGHSITGLANLQASSLAATISFFIGGLFVVHILGL